jgi:hypothetical protein
MPDSSGAALPDEVAEGMSGGMTTSVGVGTGGNMSVGNGGSVVVTLAEGAAELGATRPGAELAGTADATVGGPAGWDG